MCEGSDDKVCGFEAHGAVDGLFSVSLLKRNRAKIQTLEASETITNGNGERISELTMRIKWAKECLKNKNTLKSS